MIFRVFSVSKESLKPGGIFSLRLQIIPFGSKDFTKNQSKWVKDDTTKENLRPPVRENSNKTG